MPIVTIIGQTASGKSELAMYLAQQFKGEIVTADSVTAYKQFNIGSAKPTQPEQRLIPHHLLDIKSPTEDFSVAEFKQLAETAIGEISKRGNLPLLVGGSGLYIDSIIFDYQFAAIPLKEERNRLNNLTLIELQAEAKTRDLDLNSVDQSNPRRIVRLIESRGVRPQASGQRDNTLVIGLRLEKEELERRITKRVDTMLTAGLEKEAQVLADTYGWDIQPMQAVGYKEWRPYLDANQTLEQTRQQIITNTKRLAKKQRTWFKRNRGIQWVNTKSEAVDLVTTFLNK